MLYRQQIPKREKSPGVEVNDFDFFVADNVDTTEPGSDIIELEICECEQCLKEDGCCSEANSLDKTWKPKTDEHKKWTDRAVRLLIELWATKEILFNLKHPFYNNKEERVKALEGIQDELVANGLMFSRRQINEKLISLRIYYGGQRRLIQNSKRNSSESVFVSKWKFYNDLNFLADQIIHRNAIEITANEMKAEKASLNTSNEKNQNKYIKKRLKPMQKSDSEEEAAFENRESLLSTSTEGNKSQDELFGELLTRMIMDIPDCHEKAMMKIELQHKIVATQYKVKTLSANRFK